MLAYANKSYPGLIRSKNKKIFSKVLAQKIILMYIINIKGTRAVHSKAQKLFDSSREIGVQNEKAKV